MNSKRVTKCAKPAYRKSSVSTTVHLSNFRRKLVVQVHGLIDEFFKLKSMSQYGVQFIWGKLLSIWFKNANYTLI